MAVAGLTNIAQEHSICNSCFVVSDWRVVLHSYWNLVFVQFVGNWNYPNLLDFQFPSQLGSRKFGSRKLEIGYRLLLISYFQYPIWKLEIGIWLPISNFQFGNTVFGTWKLSFGNWKTGKRANLENLANSGLEQQLIGTNSLFTTVFTS